MKQNRMAIIAVACGLVCAACVMAFMVHVRGEADAARSEALARFGGEQVEACVATRDIVAGERVDFSAVETKLWVADLLPDYAVRSSSDIVGKTATSDVFKGEVFVQGRFEAGHDAIEVPKGKQAVSVPARAVQAVGGAIRPGMSVDIYSSGDSTTAVLEQNVSVLDTSMGSSGVLASGENGWITLAVDPERVQELISASNRTTLYFTLPGAPFDAANAEGSSAGDGSGAEGGAGANAVENPDGGAGASGDDADDDASGKSADGSGDGADGAGADNGESGISPAASAAETNGGSPGDQSVDAHPQDEHVADGASDGTAEVDDAGDEESQTSGGQEEGERE